MRSRYLDEEHPLPNRARHRLHVALQHSAHAIMPSIKFVQRFVQRQNALFARGVPAVDWCRGAGHRDGRQQTDGKLQQPHACEQRKMTHDKVACCLYDAVVVLDRVNAGAVVARESARHSMRRRLS